MSPSRLRRFALLNVILLAVVAISGCGGSDESQTTPVVSADATEPPPATTETAPAPAPAATPDLPGLPTEEARLIAGYADWTELATPPAPSLRPLGEGAHQGEKRIWASPNAGVGAGDQSFPYPKGSVVVKAGRSGGAVTLIAIMQKVRENDAQTGGWRYVEYTRSAATEDFAKVGAPESICTGCHVQANTTQKTDWVFSTK